MKGRKVVHMSEVLMDKLGVDEVLVRRLSEEIARQMERQKTLCVHRDGNFYTNVTFDPADHQDGAYVIFEQDLDFNYAPIQIVTISFGEFMQSVKFVLECMMEELEKSKRQE